MLFFFKTHYYKYTLTFGDLTNFVWMPMYPSHSMSPKAFAWVFVTILVCIIMPYKYILLVVESLDVTKLAST